MSDQEGSLPPPPPPVPPGDAVWAGSPPPAAQTLDAGQLRGLRTLSTAVMALVGIVAVLNLASIPNDLSYISNLQEIVDGGFPDFNDIEDQEDMRGTFGALILVALVVAGVLWIVWQQRARKCAKALGAAGQRYSEPLAALSWFIPFANFVLPKQVTNDLWRASDPDAPPVTSTDGKPVWPLIDAWWVLWIVGGVIGRFLLNADEPDTVDQLDDYISTLRLELGSTILTVVSAVLGILIVNRITLRLIERAQRAGVSV